LVAVLDYVTGPELSFSIFYLLPVSFAAAFVSRRGGWVVAALCAGLWGFLDIATGRGYTAAWIPYWNTAVRFGFFLLVDELIDGLRTAHARERALSRTDSLTGIANSRVFEEHADRAIAQCRRTGRPFTIACVDLDLFKHVNDEFGHAEGDRLLRVVAGLFTDGLRETDVVARLGGDEFGILMPDAEAEQARVTLERIAATLVRDVQDRWSVGATFGVVTFSEPPPDVDSAMHQADLLMYRGKENGRGCIVQGKWHESGGACD
jgi:diguanylate cyclase (GGDEF)-like protein